MSTSKATPGPWRTRGLDINSGNTVIAQVTGSISNDSSLSDARLIAAAPELRDALRGMIELCDGTCPAPGRTNVAENARALIARLDAEDK